MTVAAGFEPGKSDNSVPKTTGSDGLPAGKIVAEIIEFGEARLAASGTPKVHILLPTDADLVGNEGATLIWVGECKLAWVEPITALGSAILLWASSTAASDGANVAAAVNAGDDEVDTPTGAAVEGVKIVSHIAAQVPEPPFAMWDGVNTIKTIAVRASQAAYAGKVILYTVE